MATLIQAPEGAPNSSFGLYDNRGECLHFVESDWDYAALASALGWVPCQCGGTDGTVDCKSCGRTVSAMLSEAFDYLEERDGEEFTIDYGAAM